MYSDRLEIVDGVDPGQYCDYAVADYGGAASPGVGMTLKQCGGMSIELRRGSGDSSESTAKRKKSKDMVITCSLLWILLCIEVKLDVCNQYVEDYIIKNCFILLINIRKQYGAHSFKLIFELV